MRRVGYENQRKRTGIGSPPSYCGADVVARLFGSGGGSRRGGVGAKRPALAKSGPGRGTEGSRGQSAARQEATLGCGAAQGVGRYLAGRSASGRFSQRFVDLSPRGASDRTSVRRTVSPGSRLEAARQAGLELPTTGATSQGAERTSHSPLAQSRLAADKKRAPKSKLASPLSTKAASCFSRCAAAPGRRPAKRRC